MHVLVQSNDAMETNHGEYLFLKRYWLEAKMPIPKAVVAQVLQIILKRPPMFRLKYPYIFIRAP